MDDDPFQMAKNLPADPPDSGTPEALEQRAVELGSTKGLAPTRGQTLDSVPRSPGGSPAAAGGPTKGDVVKTGVRRPQPESARWGSWNSWVLIFLGATALGLGLEFSGLISPLSNLVYDSTLQFRTHPAAANDVVLVGINGEDERIQGQWPWPRDVQAQLFNLISDLRPEVVAVDIFYQNAKSARGDGELGEAIGRLPNSVGAYYFNYAGELRTNALTSDQVAFLERSGDVMGADLSAENWLRGGAASLPIDAAASQFARGGHISLPPERDRVVRRIPLILTDGRRFYPSLALQAALLKLGVDWSALSLERGRLRIHNVEGVGTLRIPLDRKGQLLVPFARDSESRLKSPSVFSLQDTWTREDLQGKIVLLGHLAPGSTDLHATPVQPSMAGLFIHGTVLQAILDQEFITEAPVWLRTAATVAICLLVVLLVKSLGSRLGALLALLIVVGAVVASAWLLASAQYWLAPASQGIAGLTAIAACCILRFSLLAKDRQNLRRTLGRHLGREVATQLVAHGANPETLISRKEATVFFSDLVGYSSTTEKLEPEVLFTILNEYFSLMIDIAIDHGATVNQLLGDGMLAFFNEPLEQKDHASRAVAMAKAMQSEVETLNTRLLDRGYPELGVRMGIATGYLTVGLVGSEQLSSYTAVGSVVNLASRICDHAGRGEIMVNSRTYHLAKGDYAFTGLGDRHFKGMVDPTPVYLLNLGMESYGGLKASVN